MPLPRYQRLAEEKKRRLLEAATAEFVAKGYEGASLTEILVAAGLGKSSYYYYFSDKEDLYATVIEGTLSRIEAETPRLELETLDAASFWPAIEGYATGAIAAFARSHHVLALLQPLQSIGRAPTPRLAPIIEKMRAHLRAAIEAGRRLGCVRTDLDVDCLIPLSEAADQVLDDRLVRLGELTPEKLQAHAKLSFDTFYRLLLPDQRAAT